MIARSAGVSRILVIQENAESSRELRLTAFNHPVEFDFRSPSQIAGGGHGISSYSAVAASIESAHQELMDTLRRSPDAGPPVILFHGAPPLQEIARWVAWTIPQEGGDTAVTMRLLSESIEYYSLASLYQQCLKIMGSQTEEKLLAHVTDTFSHELGVESCVIWLASQADPDEMTIASVRGMISIDREGSRFYLSQADWSESIVRGNPFVAEGGAPGRDKGGAAADPCLYVPLVHRAIPIGLVKLGARGDGKPFSERDGYIARIVADYAASSWKNITRIGRMEKISLRDRETRAYSAAFLEDYFAKERYKAGRFRRPLSVVFIVIDNYASLLEQTRESLVAASLSDMVEAVRKALRDSDLIARVDQNRFCVVLPETDYFGSILASRRLRKAIREKCAIQYLGSDHALSPFFMSATFPRDGKDLQDLWRIAEAKYVQRQKSPFHRMNLVEKPFWRAFDLLVGKPEHYDLLRKGKEVPYFSRIRRDFGRNGHFCLGRETFHRMVESVAQDVVSWNEDRGLVIAAGPRPEMFKQIFLSFGADAPAGRNIYIIGQSGSTRFDSKNLLYVTAEDERLKDREIILFLKENGAYGLFASDRLEEVCGFNTADEWLVEAMMEKVQDLYHLQGNF